MKGNIKWILKVKTSTKSEFQPHELHQDSKVGHRSEELDAAFCAKGILCIQALILEKVWVIKIEKRVHALEVPPTTSNVSKLAYANPRGEL